MQMSRKLGINSICNFAFAAEEREGLKSGLRASYYPFGQYLSQTATTISRTFVLYFLRSHKVNRPSAPALSLVCTRFFVGVHALFRLGAGKRINLCE